MNAKQKKCWKYGHDWAYSFDYTKNGWILAKCLRCDSRQYFFTSGDIVEPIVDDDSPEDQDE